MSGVKQEYRDRTPIEKIIPDNYKPISPNSFKTSPLGTEKTSHSDDFTPTNQRELDKNMIDESPFKNEERRMAETTNGFSTNSFENSHTEILQSSPQQIPDVDIERLLEDLPEECEDESLVDKFKKYIKIVLILVVIFVLISNKYVLQFLNNNIGNLTVSTIDESHLTPTVSGIFVQGSVLGIVYVIVTSLLIYIGFL